MSIRIGGYLSEAHIESLAAQGLATDVQEADKLTEMPLKLIREDPVTISRVRQCVYQAIMDGYTHIVYNFVRSGNSQLTERDTCTFKGFDLEELWNEQAALGGSTKQEKAVAMPLPKYDQVGRPSTKNLNTVITQSTRLTVCLENATYMHNFKNQQSNPKHAILLSYDLIALRVVIPSYSPSLKTDKAKFFAKVGQNAEMVFEQLCKGDKAESDIVSVDLGVRLPFFLSKSCVKQALVRGALIELDYGSGMLEFSQGTSTTDTLQA